MRGFLVMRLAIALRAQTFIATAAVAIALSLFFSASASAQDKVALVIGNGAYRNVPELANPPNDAADIAAALGRLGFSARLVTNATYDDMRRALLDFSQRARRAEMAVVFFAGHGMEVAGENWLIPVDAELKTDLDAEQEAISLRSLMLMVSVSSKLGLVVLDACRNNPFVNKMKRTISSRTASRGLTAVEPATNVLVAYAAKDGTTASDGAGRNSPFTTALLKYIEMPGLEINFLFRNVRDEVITTTHNEQQPFTYGSLSREEIFFTPPLPNAALPAVDEIAWSSLKETTDEAALKRFTAQYPGSARRKDAEARIAALAAARAAQPVLPSPDQASWDMIKETIDDGALKRFVAQYPNSALRKDAEARIAVLTAARAARPVPPSSDQVSWELIKDTTDESALKRFVARYPDSALRKDADGRIAALEAAKPPKPAAPDDAAPIKDPLLLNEVRDRLYELNFDPGPLSGSLTDATRQAIREFEQQTNLSPTGIPTMGLLRRLREAGELKPWGAIVYGKGNAKWGMAWGQTSRKAAVAKARASCGDVTTCPVEISFFAPSCGVFAYSDSNWAIMARDEIGKAKSAALEGCSKRGKSCQVAASVCADGTQRVGAK
jgi:uncharacterized caspase-like protein